MKKLVLLMVASSLVLTACGEKPEKERFVDATVEVACAIFGSGDFSDLAAMEAETKEIFADHGFDSSDDEAMKALTDKYSQDSSIEDALKVALEECAGDLLQGAEDVESIENTLEAPADGEEAAE